MAANHDSAAARADEPPIRLGGMALRNGILVQSLDHWAAAVRTSEGDIKVASGKKPDLPEWLVSVPGMRGVARVAEAGYLLPIVRRSLPQARLPLGGGAAAAAMAAAIVLRRAVRVGKGRALPAGLLGAGISMAPALLSLRGSQLAGYHGAEHKAIGAYEKGTDDVDATKEHERCGSHLVGPLLAATAAGNLAVSRLPAARRGPARLAAGGAPPPGPPGSAPPGGGPRGGGAGGRPPAVARLGSRSAWPRSAWPPRRLPGCSETVATSSPGS